MNQEDELLLSFNINKLDARLGFEISRRIGQLQVSDHDDDTIQTVEIQFAVKPFNDLIIDKDVEVLLVVPKHYFTHGSIRAHIVDKKWFDFLKGRIGDDGALQLPTSAVQKSKTQQYPFIVWFHLIRSYFKVRFDTPWVSAPLLNSQFMLIHADWPVHTDRNGSSTLSLYCGAGRTRGRRGYMEDVDFTFESLQVDEQRCVNIYGVLDGHGGRDCAQFCADEIPMKIVASLRSGCQCTEALYRSFIDADSEFLQSDSVSNAGTTANVAVYDAYRNVFYVANTGDTRAVLCRHGKALDLTYDRKGSDPEEISRIIAAGGFVSQGRVMGTLAVTRALGDIQLKEQGRSTHCTPVAMKCVDVTTLPPIRRQQAPKRPHPRP
jgi:serine/threonine protein phosphatase PrpC